MNRHTTVLFLLSFILILSACQQESSTDLNSPYDELLDEYLQVSGQEVKNSPMLSDMYDMPMFEDLQSDENSRNMLESMILEMDVNNREFYREELDQAELIELIKFYRSPLGKKVVDLGRKKAMQDMTFTTDKTMKQLDEVWAKDDTTKTESDKK